VGLKIFKTARGDFGLISKTKQREKEPRGGTGGQGPRDYQTGTHRRTKGVFI